AAAQVGTETVLRLGVAERPRALTATPPPDAKILDPMAPEEGLQPIPPDILGEDLVGLTYLDATTEPPAVVSAYMRWDVPGIDLTDPRRIRIRVPPARPQDVEEVYDYLTFFSHLRVARSADGIHFQVDSLPAVMPANCFEEYGCEDPRATLIDGVW